MRCVQARASVAVSALASVHNNINNDDDDDESVFACGSKERTGRGVGARDVVVGVGAAVGGGVGRGVGRGVFLSQRRRLQMETART